MAEQEPKLETPSRLLLDPFSNVAPPCERNQGAVVQHEEDPPPLVERQFVDARGPPPFVDDTRSATTSEEILRRWYELIQEVLPEADGSVSMEYLEVRAMVADALARLPESDRGDDRMALPSPFEAVD